MDEILQEHENTAGQSRKWVCTVCGYVHEGPTPPPICPICGVPASEFRLMEEG